MEHNKKFNELEKHLFTRMVEYFIRSEERELYELKLPSGNPRFIPQVEANLSAFKSIKEKVEKSFF